MGNYHINILPEIGRIWVPVSVAHTEDSNVSGQHFSYQQGFGQLSRAGATVQIGVTGHIDVELTMKSLSEEFYQDTTNEITHTVSTSIAQELKETSSSKNYSSWWFAFLAGGSNNQHDSSYYRNMQSNTVNIDNTKYFNSASSKMSSHQQSFKISGKFDIVGQSYLPTTVFLFIETLTVQTSEGTSVVIPTQNTAVADASGNTGGGTTSSKLSITPL